MSLKRTPFFDIHSSLGAKIVPFAGFEMPIQYGGIIEEHKRVREAVGVFDVSHMGEIEVRGHDALAFVQKITTNDASKLSEGRVQYSVMCYENGGIVDDLLVYHLGDRFMLVVNASNIEKDFSWMKTNLEGDVTLHNKSDDIALLAVQGPHSGTTLQKLTSVDLSSLKYYTFLRGTIGGVDAIISRTGYTGELGFELYFRAESQKARELWDALMMAGKEFHIGPAGLASRDSLRLEMGFCLYGNDIDQDTHPLEAGLGWITKLEKPSFVGRDALLEVKKRGVSRKLTGFGLTEKAFPRKGYEISSNGTAIGSVTSGTFSPILDKGIGMGYVPAAHTAPGTTVHVNVRGKHMAATVVSLPFINK
jgi:aminomethyltransferase